MSRSEKLLERAAKVIPGGVNSPVRAFNAVGGNPPFAARGEGPWLVDEDCHRYVDLVGSWGALIHGHAYDRVVAAATRALVNGSSFGAPTEGEVLLAEEICARLPSVEQVRLCSSGTEATMHAVRLARGATGRDLVVKMEGCYHGAHDALLVSAGSGGATCARPGSPGIPEAVSGCTLVVPFNDPDAATRVFAEHGDQIAAVILEPVPGNMGCIVPVEGYLEHLRDLTEKYGAVLIFDEVMSGFRVGPECAQGLYGVRPDLTTLGKVVGGGLPLAAFGGRTDLMARLAPAGPVYQAGTLSGNPVAVAAGLASLRALDGAAWDRLETIGAQFDAKVGASAAYHGVSYVRVGGMFTLFFRETPPRDFAEVKECDLEAFSSYHMAALSAGVYLPPSQFEAAFLNLALDAIAMDQATGGIAAALVATAI